MGDVTETPNDCVWRILIAQPANKTETEAALLKRGFNRHFCTRAVLLHEKNYNAWNLILR